MSVIFFLIGIGILVAAGFLTVFIWTVRSGQYDDTYTPSVRILFDDQKKEDVDDHDKELDPRDDQDESIIDQNNHKN